jgi:hypothetical protein
MVGVMFGRYARVWRFLAMLGVFFAGLGTAQADPATVILFMGQSNMNALGTQTMQRLPGDPSFNASCLGFITAAKLTGASANSGTLTCVGAVSGTILPGQLIAYASSDGTRYVSSLDGSGSSAVTAGSGNVAVGTAQAPVLISLAMPDIGGSGHLNANCMIWEPNLRNSGGDWRIYHRFVNGRPINGAHMFGPEASFCQQWTAANPDKTLYMIKASQGGSFLCNMPASNNVSPEGLSNKTRVFAFAQQEVGLAEVALASQLGIADYRLSGVVYVQGEQDQQNDLCGFPMPPFNSVNRAASASGPNVYLANLTDLIGRLAIEKPINASFSGSISGTVLTVSAVNSGQIHRYQALTGAVVLANTYIDGQIDGTPGGVGRYNLLVDQASGLVKATIANSSGASTACGYVSGTSFLADPMANTNNAITASCVSGGKFQVGDTLSGGGLLAGTLITGLDAAGHTADGLYTINVGQTVDNEPMSATVSGWGKDASTARFILNRTAGAGSQSIGVRLAQQFVNDNPGATGLAATTINTNDRLIYTPNPLHYDGRWYSEFGRRLYQAFIGKCDYHTPTC